MGGGKTIGRAAGACAALLFLLLPVAAAAREPDRVRHLARSLARQIAAPWPDRQYADGRFRDEVGGRSAFGEAVLGYSLIGVGLREHDRRLVRTGLRAIRYATDPRSPRDGKTSVIQNAGVGLAYNLAEGRLADDPLWERIRPVAQEFIRRQPLVHLRADNDLFGNKLLFEAMEVLAFRSTGVTSSRSDAIVGPDRDRIAGYAASLLRERVPRLFASDVRRVDGDLTLLLSDRPDDPLAYMGLSSGLYARGIEQLGGAAGGDARVAVRRSAEAAWRLMAPDGDVAWAGRQLEQAWSLSGFAYATRAAETYDGTSARRARRYDGVALRALERLRELHVGGRAGIWTVPAQRTEFTRSRFAGGEGDGYASYGGLALVFLNMLAGDRPRRGQAQDPLSADETGASVLGHGQSLYATHRSRNVWLAVRGRNSLTRADDLRYDAGLVALKRRQAGDTWTDVIPRRPLLPARGVDAAGPLIHTSSGTAVFAADRIRRRGGRGLEAVGGYRRLRGRPGVSRSASERFRPVGCGAVVSFRARPGDRIEYSVFLRDLENSGRAEDGVVTATASKVEPSPRGHVSLSHDWISASDPRVMRARFTWHPRKARRIQVRICQE